MNRKNVCIGLSVTVFFTILQLLGVFNAAGDQVYDAFLRFRRDREKTGEVVFLDIDDHAIAYNGIFPWPRSITADGLLRLKEFGARAAVFDIEYIDKGPQGVDTIYLNRGLTADFNRTFSEINTAAVDVLAALQSGRISGADLDDYSHALSGLIRSEHRSLLARAQGVARDNDRYLFEASALFGRSWVSLNLRNDVMEGEQAERRAMAEERFSYPVAAQANANTGKFIDILPPLPGFAQAAQGAGFTNVRIDKDGIRRRIDLAQNVYGHWYLQLAFSPLIGYLGNPELRLSNREMIIQGARMPGGVVKDIRIPLDGDGRMMLDWPKEVYDLSYRHLSFALFSLLEDLEAELEQYSREFDTMAIPFFAEHDAALARIPVITGKLSELFDKIHVAKNTALEQCSDDSFNACVEYRRHSRTLIRELLAIDPAGRVNALVPALSAAYPENAGPIGEAADDITTLAGYLSSELERYESTRGEIERMVRDKFCILGRVDTGTTDIGANPFHGEYVNVGTHGVVLDMILSESFIVPIGTPWQIVFAVMFVLLFLLPSGRLSPIPRTVSGFLAALLVIMVPAAVFRVTGYFFNPLLMLLSIMGAVILREIIAYAGSEREKQFIRKAFSTYVSHDVVKEILSDPSRLRLGGTKHHMTAVFTDVQGFSGISEHLDPEKLVALLNRYLTAMSDVLLAEKGTIDKYEGDAIIAFFGAPVDLPDHALRACVSAITMKRTERELNDKLVEEKLSPMPLVTRIGINTGGMVAGNMGTGSKMNYTIMGNAVNLAARLEGVNKHYGSRILASDETVRETGGRILTRRLDRVRVVGINEPVLLHELVNIMEDASPREKRLVEVFHQALEWYENRNWHRAKEGFREVLAMEGTGPAAVYLARCEQFLLNPPEDSWDGVHNLTEK